MFGNNAAMERVRQRFADQFTEESGRLVYRKSLIGPPVELAPAERDSFVARFNKDLGRLQFAFVAVLIIAVVGGAVAAVVWNWDVSAWEFLVPVAVLMVPYVLIWRRIWAAPALALAGRAVVGQQRSKDEVRREMLQKMTWGRIASGGAVSLLALWRVHWDQSLWRGDNLMWLALAVLVLAAVAVAAIRKYRAMDPAERPRLRI